MSPADDLVGWVDDYDGTVSILDTWSADYDMVRKEVD